jgi:hypothetical protein
MSDLDKEMILEGHAHITRMERLEKERSKREKSGKPSVEGSRITTFGGGGEVFPSY